MSPPTRKADPLLRFVQVAALAGFAAACTQALLEPTSQPAVETVPLHILARNIASYRGRTVRTCGRWRGAQRSGAQVRAWQLSRVDPTSAYRFSASVLVSECRGRRPRLADGCIVGTVAREDRSLEPPDSIIVTDHQIISYEWWLHPQCTLPR